MCVSGIWSFPSPVNYLVGIQESCLLHNTILSERKADEETDRVVVRPEAGPCPWSVTLVGGTGLGGMGSLKAKVYLLDA